MVKRRPPPFIEITSPGPGDGKQHLLYHITTVAVLPSHIYSIPIGGRSNAIIVLDTENRFSIGRLVQIMRSYISTRLAQARKRLNPPATFPSLSDIETTIHSALTHIHTFRPQSLASLLATVNLLPSYLFDTSSHHHSSAKAIHSILISSLSAFTWSDRSDTDLASLPTTTTGSTTTNHDPSETPVQATTKPQSAYVPLASALKRVSNILHTPVIYTTWNLSTHLASNPNRHILHEGTGSRSISRHTHLPSPWPNIPNLILSIRRHPIRKFPVGSSAEEAFKDGKDRNAVVAQGRFDVCVLSCGPRGAAGRDDVEGGFEVRITAEGIEIVDS